MNTNVAISITRDAESHLIGNSKRTASGGPETFSDTIIRLSRQHENLHNLLRECRSHIDVSLINNSKRATAKWSALVDKIEAALKETA